MVKLREEQIGGITILDEDGSGSVNGSDAFIQNIKSISLNEEPSVPGGIPSLGTGKVWFRDDGYLVVTDDNGTDLVLGSGGEESLSETLSFGNTTGGNNIEISIGDVITNEVDTVGFTIQTKSSDTPGNLNIRGGVSSGIGSGGGVYLYTGNNTGTGNGGLLLMETGTSSNSSGGNLDINLGNGQVRGGSFDLSAGNGTTDDGGYIELNSGYSPIRDGNISLIAGGSVGTSATGGSIQVEASDGSSFAGNINLLSGDSSGGSAGFVNVQAGNGSTNGGFISLSAGNGDTKAGYVGMFAGDTNSIDPNNSGYIDLIAGNGVSGGHGGVIRVTAGNSDSGFAGNVDIAAGNSTTGTAGYVNITSGSGNFGPGNLTLQINGINTFYSTNNIVRVNRVSSNTLTTALEMDLSETIVNAANGNSVLYSSTSGDTQVQIRKPSGSTILDSSLTTSVRDQTGSNAFIADNTKTELLVDNSYFIRGTGTNITLRAGANIVLSGTATSTDIRAGAVSAVIFDNVTDFSSAATNNILIKGASGFAKWDNINSIIDLDGYALLDGSKNFIGTVGGLTPVSPTDFATKGYVDSLASGIVWQEQVLDKDLTSPPLSPLVGDRYIVSSVASGDWTDFDGYIAEYNGTSWDFQEPEEGFAAWVEDEDKLYIYVNSWQIFGSVIDHGNLVGLGDDDHLQYLRIDGFRAMTGDLQMATNDIVSLGNINLGSDPATVGVINISNNQSIAARNAANTANFNLLRATASDRIAIGQTANVLGVEADGNLSHIFQINNVTKLTITDTETIIDNNLNMGTNDIVSVGLVDGRDVSVDGSALDAHIADDTIHFTKEDLGIDGYLSVGSTITDTWDPGTVLDNGVASTTFTVSSNSLASRVLAVVENISVPAGILIDARMLSTTSVLFQVLNLSGVDWTPGSLTIGIDILR